MFSINLKSIIIIIIVIGLFLYVKFEFCVPEIDCSLSKPLEQIDFTNGSLIFLSGNTSGENIFRSITDSPFSHVGMLFKENDIPYIIDCDIGQGMKKGVRVQDLRHKLARYKGNRIGSVRVLRAQPPALLPSKEQMIGLIEKYKDLQFDNKMITWLVSNYALLHQFFKNKDRVFCSELVAECMKELSIIDNSTVSSGYSPRDFFNIDTALLNDGYSFDSPISIEF